MVMATQPRVVAGGSTICTRSPVGSDADSSGADSIDALPGDVGDQLGQPPAPVKVGERQLLASPAGAASR